MLVANAGDCRAGSEVVRLSISDALHWLPGAGISFARGVNDTPKIAGVLLVAWSAQVEIDYALVAIAMVLGGV